jgi:hypothetical protein
MGGLEVSGRADGARKKEGGICLEAHFYGKTDILRIFPTKGPPYQAALSDRAFARLRSDG